MSPRELRQCRVENLRRPRTRMADAFLRALRGWALRHAADAETTIAIPAGFVSHEELRCVVLALISLRERETAENRR
jgi:hypothetical protein